MLVTALVANLFGNVLASKGVIRGGGVIKAGEENIRAGSIFNIDSSFN